MADGAQLSGASAKPKFAVYAGGRGWCSGMDAARSSRPLRRLLLLLVTLNVPAVLPVIAIRSAGHRHTDHGAELIGGTNSRQCKDLQSRASARILLPRDRERKQPGVGFVPITHPWMGPFCITPVLQGVEQAGFTYLEPIQQTRHIGAPSPLGKNRTTPSSWRVDEADLVVQYYRTPGDRSGTAQLQHLPPEVRAMDEPIAVDGTRLVWGVPNASNIGGHKHITYQAMRRWVRAHGCELDRLQILPEQFLLSDPIECEAFFRKYGAIPGSASTDSELTWFLKDGTKHGSRGISIHRNASSVRAAFGECPLSQPVPPLTGDSDGVINTTDSNTERISVGRAKDNTKLSWEDRKQFWSGSQKGADRKNFGDRRGVLVQREVPSVLVSRPDAAETAGRRAGSGLHKIAMRAYMVIVRVDPLLVVWAANASYVKITPDEYDPKSTDLRAQVSDSFRSTGVDSDGNVDNKVGAKAEGEEGWQPISWLAAELGTPGLVEDVLAPQIMVLFQTLIGAASLGRDLGAWQILGIDIALRPDLNIVEFEGNMAPGWIAEAPPGDDRCAQEPGCPWLHARNQQLVADATRLVVMAHGGIRHRESSDPKQLFNLLREGRMFRVVPPYVFMADEGKTAPGPDLDSPFDVGPEGAGVPRETFVVAYNELQRVCSTSGSGANGRSSTKKAPGQRHTQRLFPDPCVEYAEPWKPKQALATKMADSWFSGVNIPVANEAIDNRDVARGLRRLVGLVVCTVVACRIRGAGMQLRLRKLRRCCAKCICRSSDVGVGAQSSMMP